MENCSDEGINVFLGDSKEDYDEYDKEENHDEYNEIEEEKAREFSEAFCGGADLPDNV